MVLKYGIAHLRACGCLLQFGSGLIEIDPASHTVTEEFF